MGRDAIEPKIYELLPTATPNERAVRLWMPQSAIRNSTVIEEGCLLKNMPKCKNRDDVLRQGYGDYVLTASEEVGEGYLGFVFGKPKELTLEATLVRSVPGKMDIAWPAVLRVFYAMRGLVEEQSETGRFLSNDTSNTVQRLRVLERLDFVPGAVLPTDVVRETYQSPKPLPKELLKARRWVTSRVSIKFGDIRFSEDCLHEDVTSPELMTDGEIVPGLGTPNPEGEDYAQGQLFPATNYTTWPKEIVLESDQRFTGRLYQVDVLRAFRPKMPPPQEIPML